MLVEKWIDGLRGDPTTRKLDALVQAYVKQGRFTGAVLVACRGRILLKKGYGYADPQDTWERNAPSTAFRIGSMSKPFTAILIMQLVEAGQLGLDDTLDRFLPDYPNGSRISLRHLLSNRSGIEDFIAMAEYERLQTRRVGSGELIALFRDRPLGFEPGTDYGYSNSNWVLLALIIEQVTGEPFAQVMRERLLRRARMEDTGVDWSSPVKRRSAGCIDTGAGMQPAVVLDSSAMRGGGDIHSTLDDLYRWDRALRGDSLLSQPTLDLMWTPLTQMDMAGYGLGFEVHRHHGQRAVGHSGGMPGYVSNIALFIDDDATIILLSNLGSAAWETLTDGLAAILFDAPYQLPTARTFVRVEPGLLKDYVGEYEMHYFGRTSILKFAVEDGRLVMDTRGLPKAVLSPLSDTSFFGRSKGEVEFTFVRDDDGRVRRIDALWAGYKLSATRIT